MLDWKRIIGIILVVVGLFLVSNTAFAQTPPAVVDDDALMSFLNSETEEDRMDDEVIRRYEALSEHGKEIVVEAWAQIVDQAPERYLNDQTEWLINVIRDADAVASIGYFIVDLYASEGYSSALSAMWGGNSWLFAAVKAEGEYYGDTCYSGIELNCIVITASLPLPVSPGTHWVRSWHDAGYPPVIDRILFSRIIIDD